MLFYVETATEKRAYADQELKTWDRNKGELSKPVAIARDEKIAALEAAISIEQEKGAFDPKAPPKTIADKETDLKETIAAEVLAHEFDNGPKLSAPVFACSWDGVAPYVTTLAGTFPQVIFEDVAGFDGNGKPYVTRVQRGGIPVAGWPQTDQPPADAPANAKERIDAHIAEAALSVEPVAVVRE